MTIFSRFKFCVISKNTENLPSLNQNTALSTEYLDSRIMDEQLRQARQSFNLAISIPLGLFLVNAVYLAAFVRTQSAFESAFASLGMLLGTYCLQLAKHTNDRLNRDLQNYSDSN
ncbi:hypothetical protein [Leptolyngbya sp. GGD]|uniref:hypothetical protein n=1 Tax=Leptolyngbya sp. GGD TaxID=2997907 RepID=UPI00227A812F|nr:hypothetical protein [Leptolyngbya sp. GGD]MCY6494605.1 hypothetical protein [Leptolyngbya sp. GGD]